MNRDGDKELSFPPPVDFCKLKPYQRQRQKDAYLAKPKSVFSYSSLWAPKKKARNTAELKAKCSPHTEMLAMPKDPLPKMHFVTKSEKEAEREFREELTKEELKWLMRKPLPPFVSSVKKSALTATCSPRLEIISMAKLKGNSAEARTTKPIRLHPHVPFRRSQEMLKLISPAGLHGHIPNEKAAIVRHIKENLNEFRSRYPPESDKMYEIINGVIVHASCLEKQGPAGDPKKLYICELNKNQRKLFRRRMKALSVPRIRLPPSSGPDRGPKKKIKEFEPWLTLISQPRFNVMNEISYDPYEVKSSAKEYVATERILAMAKPRIPPPPPPLLDFEGNELPPRREWSFASRRRIIASPRTIELATPRFVKKKAAEDTKEDPFAVPRRALTAFCNQRTKELAEPRKRG